jgi:molybdopterin synthase catalytic subunit
MKIQIHIVDGALPIRSDAPAIDGAGAVVCFAGIVREIEDGRVLEGIDYEAYLPMAELELRRLAEQVAAEHGLLAIHVHHSRGMVKVGECSFRLLVASAHRKASLAAMDQFIDRMKQDVPIWKQAVFAGDR